MFVRRSLFVALAVGALAFPAPAHGQKVIDLTGKDVSGVQLKPGMKYKLNLTVKADHSETAQIFFKTN